MCLSLRNTDSRGRSGEPVSDLRMPHLRRCRRTCFAFCLSAISVARASCPRPKSCGSGHGRDARAAWLLGPRAGERLARLDLHDLALVADALALVRLGLAHAAQVAGELPDELLVGACHRD